MRLPRLPLVLVAVAAAFAISCSDGGSSTAATPPAGAGEATTTAGAPTGGASSTGTSASTPPADPYDLQSSTPAATSVAVSPTAAPTPSGANPAASAPAIVSATIANFALPSITVAVGTTVEWTNGDAPTPHTATSTQGLFDSGNLGATPFRHTFTEAGTFAYACRLHPSMTATITVQ